MIATLIVPDVHGDLDMAAGLLRQAGALNDDWERVRRDEIRTVQLGDLLNCVGDSVVDDMRCLDHAREFFDVLLVGNHEHPYWGGPRFSGYWRDLIIDGRIRTTLADLYRPSIVVDGILVTHAGVSPAWGFKGEHDADDHLNRWWKSDPAQSPAFAAIGRSRGGSSRLGGVLWADWDEPKAPNLKQIVGHTVGRAIRRVDHEEGGWAVCLDLGGGKHDDRLAGALIRDGEVEVIVYDRTAKAAA